MSNSILKFVQINMYHRLYTCDCFNQRLPSRFRKVYRLSIKHIDFKSFCQINRSIIISSRVEIAKFEVLVEIDLVIEHSISIANTANHAYCTIKSFGHVMPSF